MPEEKEETMEEKTELTSLDGEYEKAVLVSLKYLLTLEPKEVTVKEYTAALEKVNKMYEVYRKTVESDRDYIRDYVKDANREAEIKLERQKHEDEKKQKEAEAKAEKKAKRLERMVIAGTGFFASLFGAGVTLYLGKKGWETTLKMQDRAFRADEEEIRPTSQGHKEIPKGNPFRV